MHSFELTRADGRPHAIAAGKTSPTAQQGASVRFLAGGTTLVDLLKLGVEHPDRVIDINRLGMDEIEPLQDGGLRMGATARNSDLAHHAFAARTYPALSQAILSGASAQLRNVATTAGNLLQRTRCAYFRDVSMPCNKREPGTGCPAISGTNRTHAVLGVSDYCIATHPSDMAVALLAYDAMIHIEGPSGAWKTALKDFYLLPEHHPDHENILQPGDLITHVTLPPRPKDERAFYLKLRDRASYEFALVSAAAALTIRDGVIAQAALAVGGVGTRPWRTEEPERALRGRSPSKEAFREAADLALRGARPQTQNGFKIELARRCIIQAFSEASGPSS